MKGIVILLFCVVHNVLSSRVVVWGDIDFGGIFKSQRIEEKLQRGIRKIYSNGYAFAAMTNDNNVVTWGETDGGGVITKEVEDLLSTEDIVTIHSTDLSFLALKKDKPAVCWGAMPQPDREIIGVPQVFSSFSAYAVLEDGGVYCFGHGEPGKCEMEELNTGVITIISNNKGFVAQKEDQLIHWGIGEPTIYPMDNVKRVVAAQSKSFAVLLKNDTVVSLEGTPIVENVKEIYTTEEAFAALLHDGTVFAWGIETFGGDISSVKDELTDVKHIVSTQSAFAALKEDGSVVTWGFGGGDSSSVQDKLKAVKQIYGARDTFVALKENKTVVLWGLSTSLGNIEATHKLENVEKILHVGAYAFVVEFTNGNTRAIGKTTAGGQIPDDIASELSNGISQVASTSGAFAVLVNDASNTSGAGVQPLFIVFLIIVVNVGIVKYNR